MGTLGEKMSSGQSVLREFSNAGHMIGGRLFAGFPAADAPMLMQIAPRLVGSIKMAQGDLLRIDGTAHNGHIALLLFSENGQRLETAHGFSPLSDLQTASFEDAPLASWIAAQGGDPKSSMNGFICEAMDEPLTFNAKENLTIWICHLHQTEALIAGDTAPPISVWHKRNTEALYLPEPLGDIRDEFTIKRGTANAYELREGEYVQIIDVEGQQCSDFQAFNASALEKGRELFIDSTATRSIVRSAYPTPGLFDKFYDAKMQPLMRVIQDTCGRHDTFGLACTARSYEERGFPGHLNCSDNISEALSPFGVAPRSAWPAINFFWNTWVDAHHQIQTEEAHSRAGDYVVMQALEDMVCASTACPDDIDPINGWNPTDIHIRIYKPTTSIRPAIAYRPKEDASMQISQPSVFHERLEPLTNHFAPARDIWAAVSFPASGTIGEYWACRNAATLQDMSGLRKFDIIGPDAERLLQYAMSRNIAKLADWRGTYSLLCDKQGEVIDDGTLFRLAPQLFRWCCGNEESGRWLTNLADENGWQVRINDLGSSLPNLALQGPKSRDILRKIAFTQPHVPALDQVKWFGATVARLHNRDGAPFLLTRTGYTGELGYELFCAPADALAIWDALIEAGSDEGLIPMGSAALEIIRVEAGLAGAAEFAAGADALEAGLGFAVDFDKPEFVGQSALKHHATAQRKILCGLKCDCDDLPLHGAPVYAGERQVGVITSSTRSPYFECAIAMARLSVEFSEVGLALEIGQLDGRMKRLKAEVTPIPFYDPKRERVRS